MNKELIPKISDKYLDMICSYLYKSLGIYIENNKRILLVQKLQKLMIEAGVSDVAEYYHFIVAPPITQKQKDLKNRFLDTVTIHKTNFFRENNHFEFIKANIDKIVQNSTAAKMTGELRVWSSACSTGEEAYTLSMVLREVLPPDIKPKILATDVSPQSVRTAIEGEYKFGPEDYISSYYVNKYFTKTGNKWRVSQEIKNDITFRLFNLVENFPFKNPFDVIFCRNVMIYFDRAVQESLVNNFYKALDKNGLLFIGHSESLIQIKHNFTYHEPTIYLKK